MPKTSWILTALVALYPTLATGDPGQQLYVKMCAKCHGATGEGTKKYEQTLSGELSIDALAKVIDKTMPEGEPEKLDAAQSRQVAEYIHSAFYSPEAQARLKPPRVELSRLTVKQYRNAVADLLAGFRPAVKADKRPGLRGEYFNARNFQGKARILDRIDPEVRFDFDTKGPEPEKFDPHQFSIRWEGAVLAPESGTYEFIVRSDHAIRLWVNDAKRPLIDAWVKSGTDTEFSAPLALLAGRHYTIRLEFSKAKQGVDDSKKNTNPPAKKASIALLWKRPHQAAEVIPTRFLSAGRVSEVFVCQTAFPPDDCSRGWERGSTISKEWDAATTEAALETAGYVVGRLAELTGVPDDAKDRPQRLREFAQQFAERAFRRPLTDDEKQLFVTRQFETSTDTDLAVKRAILLVLKSPRFLYPDAAAADQYAIATRLALALWDAPPDAELLAAAKAGKLNRAEVVRHAERMLADPRAKAKLREFLLAWLKVDQNPDLAKDTKRYPGFDATTATDLRTSFELFLDDVLWSDGDFRRFLLAEELFLNGRLAKQYGADLPAEAPFTKVKLDAGQRAGIVTHPYLLSAFAYTKESSPIHRGVFLARGVLGITLRPPQEAFTPLEAEQHPDLTTRERVALQTKPAACISCHGIINPLGFTLERFDAVGRIRDKESGKPVDDDGAYQTRSGEVVKFDGPRQLAEFLAKSPEVHAAFVEKLFHHLVKQPVRAYGVNRPDELRKVFVDSKFDVRKLVVEIAATAALAKQP